MARLKGKARKAAKLNHGSSMATVPPQDQAGSTELQYHVLVGSNMNPILGSTDYIVEARSGSSRVGSINAHIIFKNGMWQKFWQMMSQTSPACKDLSQHLFDRYGCLKEEFITGDKRGSGVWGREANKKCIVVIDLATVEQGWEDEGVMEQLFMRLFDHAVQALTNAGFVIVRPDLLRISSNGTNFDGIPMPSMLESDPKVTKSKELLRMRGYRRVGASPWFAKAFSTDHPSQTLDVVSDFEVDPTKVSELNRMLQFLEMKRTQARRGNAYVDVSNEFKGYKTKTVENLLALQGLSRPFSSEQITMAKFGCTCGKCVNGYISPRMLFTLEKQSEKVYLVLRQTMMSNHIFKEYIKDPKKFQDHIAGAVWPACCPTVQLMMMQHKKARMGHAYVFYYIARLLRSRSLPFLSQLSQDIENANLDFRDDPCPCCKKPNKHSPQKVISIFMHFGGTVGSCLKGLFDFCMAEDEKAGHDTFHLPLQTVPGWDFAQEYEALPRCRNDSEFGFVLGMLLEH